MTKNERDFINDIKEALDDWGFSYEYYHENGDFCVDVAIDDIDEWADCSDDIWDALNDVCDEWGAGIDSDMNSYYLCLESN